MRTSMLRASPGRRARNEMTLADGTPRGPRDDRARIARSQGAGHAPAFSPRRRSIPMRFVGPDVDALDTLGARGTAVA